jgi:hypothetical protein
VAALGGWCALQLGGGLLQVFMAQAIALVIYGLINTWAVAGGTWFGPMGWPRSTAMLLQRVGNGGVPTAGGHR